jgi:hypothetical protein
MTRLIGRLFLVAFAFLVASGAALTTLFVLGSMWIGETFVAEGNLGPEAWPIAPVIGGFFFAGAVGPALTAVPGLVAIVLGEGLNIRSIVYYGLAGAASMAAIPILAARDNPQAAGMPASDYLIIFLAAGALAGLVYWTIAGRTA